MRIILQDSGLEQAIPHLLRFHGGVSAGTAEKILNDTEIQVPESGGIVEVVFDSGRIGNFTSFEIGIRQGEIEEIPGGHRMKGRIVVTKTKTQAVTILTVKGSKIDAPHRHIQDRRPQANGIGGADPLQS